MIEKVMLTEAQARMIENHRNDFRLLMDKRITSNCPTNLDGISVENVVRAFIDGYEIERVFKIGDWVICDWGGTTKDTFKVVEIKDGKPVIDWFRNPYPKLEWLRHATSEEIKAEKERRLWEKEEKERRMWTKINREVGEIKIGDMYEHLTGQIYKVDKTDRISRIKGWLSEGKIRGIYPVESFISFEDGEEK